MSPFNSRSPALPKTTSPSMLTEPGVALIAAASGARRLLAPREALVDARSGHVAGEEEVAPLARRPPEAGVEVEDVRHAGVEVQLCRDTGLLQGLVEARVRLDEGVGRAVEDDGRREARRGIGKRVRGGVVPIAGVIRHDGRARALVAAPDARRVVGEAGGRRRADAGPAAPALGVARQVPFLLAAPLAGPAEGVDHGRPLLAPGRRPEDVQP